MVESCARKLDHDILFRCGEVLPRIPWRSTCSSLFAAGQSSRSGRVAQLVEHSTLNRLVAGSIPAASTISPFTLNNLTIETLARREPPTARIVVLVANYRPSLVTLWSHWTLAVA